MHILSYLSLEKDFSPNLNFKDSIQKGDKYEYKLFK